ncbi:MAG: cysteine desulfurase family protein [Patescibacteria group bacterium]
MKEMGSNYIYLDYAASTPIRDEVLSELNKIEKELIGNPSSVHSAGRSSMNKLDAARKIVADILNCESGEIVFTSGGTESNTLALMGFADAHPKGHIITSSFEHKAVLENLKLLEGRGWKISYIKPDKNGLINAKKVIDEIKDNTRLVSIMYVNNEIGTIQPIREIGKQLESLNRTRTNKIYFHTDAVQAAPVLEVNSKYLHVDLMTLSSHKIGGPKGGGLLFVKKGTPLHPIINGGGQERGFRSGTQNIYSAIGLALALEQTGKNLAKEVKRLHALQNKILTAVNKLDGVVVNGTGKQKSPAIVNFSWKKYSSDELVIALDRIGIAVSAASACASGSIQKSHVLSEVPIPEWRAASSVRISMGHSTATSDINKLIAALKKMA